MFKSFLIYTTFFTFSASCVSSLQNSSQVLKLNRLDPETREKIYLTAYGFMKNSKAFQNMTFEEIKRFADETDAWTPPAHIATDYPYYLAGYDFEDRPIWIAEVGKYRWGKLLDGDKNEVMRLAEKMMFKVVSHFIMSLAQKDKPNTEAKQIVLIADYDGYDMEELKIFLAHKEFIQFYIRKANEYLDIIAALVGETILINANYSVTLFMDFIRPIVGELMERLTVLGMNKYKWKAELKRILPEKSIPPWYGGAKDFTPVAVFG